jgi:hypothetical protein
MGEGRCVYRVLVVGPERKRQLGRHRQTWEDNIEVHLRELAIIGTNWVRLAEDRAQCRHFVNTFNDPPGSIKKGGYFLAVTVSFSNLIPHHGVSFM